MKSLEVVNPFDLSVIGSVLLCDWEQADQYLSIAEKLFRNRKAWLPTDERVRILKKVAHLMSARKEQLAFLIANEGGKPLIDARVEVTRAIDGVEICIKELSHGGGEEIPMGLNTASANKLAFTMREPIGVVLAISAFNHPLNLIVHQVAPAVAVGCPVLVKPADDTPLSCEVFVNLLYEAGLSKEWCRFIPCDLDVAEKLVSDPRIAFLSFIGSAKVGWMLRSRIAAGTRCALEHGGCAPVIVGSNADISQMIPKLVKGGFYHSGQVCVSVQRVFVPHLIAQDIAQQIANQASLLIVDNAIKEETECGPLIRPREVDRVASWIEEAKSEGAQIICGGTRLSKTCYEPTVLLNPHANSKVSRQEIFGPAICVYSYEKIEEVFDMANSLPFAFQSSVFTNNFDFAFQAVKALDASAVMINEHTAFRTDWMPFAGRRQSGYGVGGIPYTMRDFTQDKMVVMSF